MTTRQARGFTLIEVLVALAVVAIALAAVVRTTGQAVRNTHDMELATLAHWIAADRLTELEVMREWPGVGERGGKRTMAGLEWAWTQTVTPSDDARIRQVEIQVRLDADDNDTVRARLNGFLTQPGLQAGATGGAS